MVAPAASAGSTARTAPRALSVPIASRSAPTYRTSRSTFWIAAPPSGAQASEIALQAAIPTRPPTASQPAGLRGSGAGPATVSASTSAQAAIAATSRGSVKKPPE